MPRVAWEDAPEWVKDAAVTLVAGEGTIERPIRFEDRGESIALWWGQNGSQEADVEKERVRAYESEAAD